MYLPDQSDPTTNTGDVPILRRTLIRSGTTDADIRIAKRDKAIQRIHRGAYLPATPDEDGEDFEAIEKRYLAKVRAAIEFGGANRYPSHQSAAALLNVPLLTPDRSSVHFVSTRSGRKSPSIVVHQAKIPADDLVTIGDTTTTSIARTVCDVARQGTFRQAICALDSGLHQARLRHQSIDLESVAARMRFGHGMPTLLEALPYATDLAESVGEAVSHCFWIEHDAIPMPQLQVAVSAGKGREYRCDAGWFDDDGRLLVVGEFDGKFKYHRASAASGHRLTEDVIYEEKLREDAIRDCGIVVVRWTWAELRNPKELERKILDALRRGGIIP